MWEIGVIVYMMLLGQNPFNLKNNCTNEEISQHIKQQRQPPLKYCPFARNLSTSALNLLSKFMEPDTKKGMTAHDMLHHPWVTGETAQARREAQWQITACRFRLDFRRIT